MLHFLITTAQQPSYRFHFCVDVNYTSNSVFPSNLNSTLSSLSSNATTRGFYNESTGRNPNRAYGLFLCRGDISPDLCHVAVRTASEDLITRCPTQVEAIIWYDECMVRYSNRSIFSTSEENPGAFLWSQSNSSDPERFNETLGQLMDSLVTQAVSGGSSNSPNFFAMGERNVTIFNRIFGLVQCTPDISQYECTICLQNAITDIPRCCNGRQGGRIVKPSCNIRFESYRFYWPRAASPAPAPSPPVVSSPPAPIPIPHGQRQNSRQTIIAIVVPIVVSLVLLPTICYCYLRTKARKKQKAQREEIVDQNEITTLQSLQYDLTTIEVATNSFSDLNKIGEGGFGVVYKGTLSNGQEVAVKRLSRHSGQGVEEFKNEVIVVAKLQHRNLVRLLGFCLEHGEKILVYEFVPNKSLDYFLFDPEKQRQLDWSRRYKIIGGIARGILYLHEDSQLKIIHRDLKASNILLDLDMNSKIADFGMARIFGVDQTQGNTNRIVGTFGYMSPEYAMQGQFSVKSDVFSFGVLILEIVSGKKNSSFYQSDCGPDLVSYAWKLWRDERPLDLMDQSLSNSYSRIEATRCIHIGLLCVQEDVADRPAMTTFVLMLNSHSVTLPLPKRPAFCTRSETEPSMPVDTDQSTSKSMTLSQNEASISELYPR